MLRRFVQHDVRATRNLSGIWDFTFLGTIESELVLVEGLRFDDRMAVPGCFDATPAYAGARGLAAYRTRVKLDREARYRLVFHGVSHWCRVFVGGVRVRDHAVGHSLFAADFSATADGWTELIVLVDNRLDLQQSPLHREYFDWYQYGGIARPVELHRLTDQWIDALTVTTQSIAPPRLQVSIDYGAMSKRDGADLSIAFDDVSIIQERVDLSPPGGRLTRVLEPTGATLWSPEAPNLHLVHVRLGDDDMRERVGIRMVGVQGTAITINGQPVRLLGICRHESHPEFGCGMPVQLLVTDAQQIRGLRCNFIRGVHYPQDLRFLDLCDEMGICVWSESIGWQQTAEQLTNPEFLRAQLEHVGEMVLAAANRPSIILWGILNEGNSNDPACRPAYETLLGRLRALDPSRLVTFASNHPHDDLCFDLADVIGINQYPGWYEGELSDLPAILNRALEDVDASVQPAKPVIMSEIGAHAIPGWRDWNEARWTEQYQVRLHSAAIKHLFVDSTRVCGLSLWQFCDHRAPEIRSRILMRARGFNNMGVVDEYRRPKPSFENLGRAYGLLSERGEEASQGGISEGR